MRTYIEKGLWPRPQHVKGHFQMSFSRVAEAKLPLRHRRVSLVFCSTQSVLSLKRECVWFFRNLLKRPVTRGQPQPGLFLSPEDGIPSVGRLAAWFGTTTCRTTWRARNLGDLARYSVLQSVPRSRVRCPVLFWLTSFVAYYGSALAVRTDQKWLGSRKRNLSKFICLH